LEVIFGLDVVSQEGHRLTSGVSQDVPSVDGAVDESGMTRGM
jgi:hypothetical protein